MASLRSPEPSKTEKITVGIMLILIVVLIIYFFAYIKKVTDEGARWSAACEQLGGQTIRLFDKGWICGSLREIEVPKSSYEEAK